MAVTPYRDESKTMTVPGTLSTETATPPSAPDNIDPALLIPDQHPVQLRRNRARRQTVMRTIVLGAVLLFFFLPLLSMLIFSVRFPLSGEWTGYVWKTIFTGESASATGVNLEPLWEGLFATLKLAVFTVVLMLVLLLPAMVFTRLNRSVFARWLEFISLLPLTIPAIVMVVGLAPIYRTIGRSFLGTDAIWLGFAYTILVLPYAYRALDAGLSAINLKTIVEAARSLGASWLTVFGKVIIPNLWPAIISSCFISIAVVFGEFTIASLLGRVNLQVGLFLVGQGDAMVATGMALLTLMLGVVSLVVLETISIIWKGRKNG